ncbi:hypothetical protein KP509_24G012300 [Ceratopteris richardii]|uniref:Uncharacterized protein n=1 Tax=Ceratopteris richardii TaxID=49495 RepID=A0A8T2RTB9_CERRI|nr:hypothetical protein KP509_24G012300 [Ceratopteris richardii]
MSVPTSGVKINRSRKMHMLQKCILFMLIASAFLSVVSGTCQFPSPDDPHQSDSIACEGLDEPSIHATSTSGFISMTVSNVEQFRSAPFIGSDVRTSSLRNILGRLTPPPGAPIIN